MRGASPGSTPVSAAETTLQPRIGTLTLTAPSSEAGRSVTIDPRGTVVGRSAEADLSLASDHVSRRHFVVRERAGGYEVEDLGSRNGTLLNGEVVAGIRRLRDGDRLSAGGVEIEFGLATTETSSARRSAPPSAGSWRPDEVTKASDPVRVRADRTSLGRELHAASSFSGLGLLLAVLGSVVGTVLAGAANAGPWGTLAGAAVTPVVSTAFATRRAGDRGRVGAVAIVLLSVGALIITVTGVSLADLATGKSVVPGNGDKSGTFPGVVAGKTRSTGSAGSASAEPVGCGAADVGSGVPCTPGAVLTYTGEGELRITRVEVTGKDAGDFVAGSECAGRTLRSGETCETGITFTASAAGPRTAVLLIHQTLPAPDQGTRVELTGVGRSPTDPSACATAPLPPEVSPGDACPTPGSL
jgi:pSer/pThr/pTyr-binding forkhead associated (FHA) protein